MSRRRDRTLPHSTARPGRQPQAAPVQSSGPPPCFGCRQSRAAALPAFPSPLRAAVAAERSRDLTLDAGQCPSRARVKARWCRIERLETTLEQRLETTPDRETGGDAGAAAMETALVVSAAVIIVVCSIAQQRRAGVAAAVAASSHPKAARDARMRRPVVSAAAMRVSGIACRCILTSRGSSCPGPGRAPGRLLPAPKLCSPACRAGLLPAPPGTQGSAAQSLGGVALPAGPQTRTAQSSPTRGPPGRAGPDRTGPVRAGFTSRGRGGRRRRRRRRGGRSRRGGRRR